MEFLILVFIGWMIWSAVANAAKNAKAKLPPPEPTVPDWYLLAEASEHVRMVGAPAPAVLPARIATEESSSELLWDEAATGREVDASGAAPAEMITLESTEVALPVEVRPMPSAAVSLEREVDWEAEHEAFHRRYVDAHSTGSAARHGLLDELRDPAVLRRAVLMAEILGPPKSARR
jgi:hypothetical protein